MSEGHGVIIISSKAEQAGQNNKPRSSRVLSSTVWFSDCAPAEQTSAKISDCTMSPASKDSAGAQLDLRYIWPFDPRNVCENRYKGSVLLIFFYA